MPVTVEAGATNLGTLSTAGQTADFVIPLLKRRSIRSVCVVQAPYGIEPKIQEENLRVSIDPGNSGLSGRGFRLGSRQIILRVTEENGAIVFTPIPLRFDLVPAIRFQPSRLVFGPVRTGETCIRQIRIIPDMVTVHEVRSAELGEFAFSSGTSARFDGSRIVGQGIELDVSIQPETAGMQNLELPVIVLGGDGHPFEMKMPVTVISRSNGRP